MKVRLFALWLVLSFIVQGCSAPTESSVESRTQGSITALIDTVTPTVSPTVIQPPTFTPVASPSLAKTDTPLPMLESAQTDQPACFTTLQTLPDTKTYQGKIIFLEPGKYENIQDVHYLGSLYDLNTRQAIPMDPHKVLNIEVSPDKLNYAVNDAADKNVKFFSANGHLIRTLAPGEYPYGLDHWLNNEQIALNILQPWGENYTKYPLDQVIYNPFTGEQRRIISEQYPDINPVDVRVYWEGFSATKYDPQLTRVVYPSVIKNDYLGKSGIGYVLWDLKNQIKLAEIVTGYFTSTPKWAPDGSRFVINDDRGDGEFYAVTRDGVVTQLTHLNSDPAAETAGRRYFSDLYSWSPDGHYLAFWLVSDQNSSIQGTLAILDTETGKVTDTCISAGFVEKGTMDLPDRYLPVWSPDGKYLVTVTNRREEGGYQSVLVDLEEELAVKLVENIFPVGWLAGGDQ
jgi:hypothetical protein